MSDDRHDDGLEEMGADALRLMLRHRDQDHREELSRLEQDFTKRLDALKKKIERQIERPALIHPNDMKQLYTTGGHVADEVSRRLKDGSLRLSTDAPEGVWLKPLPKLKMTRSELTKILREGRTGPDGEWARLKPLLERKEVEIIEG